jgi:hypothetical protein
MQTKKSGFELSDDMRLQQVIVSPGMSFSYLRTDSGSLK